MYSKAIEDYLEAIYNITHIQGYARTKDIANELDIRAPSVTEMIQKLRTKKLVNYEKYNGVTLTVKGAQAAKCVKERHDIIKKFLGIIQVYNETAEQDACRIEHEVSPQTLEQLTKFVRFIESHEENLELLDTFKEFCEKSNKQ